MMPVRTSPLPAVASWGTVPPTTQTPCARRADERVRALQQHDAAVPLDRPSQRLEPVRVHPRRLLADQPAELAGVRRQHGRRLAVERLQLVEGVRVDDRGDVRREERAHERLAVGAAAEARPDRERRRALRRVDGLLERTLHRLDELRLDHGQRRRPAQRRRRSPRRRGTQPTRRGSRRRSSRAAPPTTSTEPGAVLVVLQPLARHEPEDVLRHEPCSSCRTAPGRCPRR